MDNACKWAENQVVISGVVKEGRLILKVEDDGLGIPPDEIQNVMRRGHKLDESKPGNGQGLGIVNDIARLYGGSLTLSRNSMGGG